MRLPCLVVISLTRVTGYDMIFPVDWMQQKRALHGVKPGSGRIPYEGIGCLPPNTNKVIMDCPHCNSALTAQMSNCPGCGWKVRLSQVLGEQTRGEDRTPPLPASDIYFIFADQFLEPASDVAPACDYEYLTESTAPVQKKPLAIGLCRVAFIWLAVSDHLQLELVTSKTLAFTRAQSVVAKPKGRYRAPTGSLENRILDSLYDRRQGLSVDRTIAGLKGFWYQGDSSELILQVVRQHVLASRYVSNTRELDVVHMEKLRPQVEEVKELLNSFAFANPSLVAALWDSIRRGLDGRKG